MRLLDTYLMIEVLTNPDVLKRNKLMPSHEMSVGCITTIQLQILGITDMHTLTCLLFELGPPGLLRYQSPGRQKASIVMRV